jgi:hypothetical protein
MKFEKKFNELMERINLIESEDGSSKSLDKMKTVEKTAKKKVKGFTSKAEGLASQTMNKVQNLKK